MSDITTPVVEVEKIDVVEDFNVRTKMDPEALARLARNIGKTELVQPLTVVATKGGRYELIAGHRRLQAAKIAGLDEVPVFIREDGNRRAAGLAENLHREDLDPIDIARGIEALAAELNLTTNKKIAEELDVSDTWVSLHLRLLKLPAGVQDHIASGEIPVDAERPLREIAATSPRIAECVCELAMRRKVASRDFVASLPDLLLCIPQARLENKPTMIGLDAPKLSDLVADTKKHRELGERHLAARPYTHTDNPVIGFSQEEVDAARAAGCLLEFKVDHEDWISTVAFLIDAEFAADLAERAIDRIEKEAEARRAEEAKRTSKGAAGSAAASTADEQSEQRKAAYRERLRKALAARRWNQELGRKLLQRRGSATRKQFALARAKAMAIVIIEDNPKLAARGLRLVSSQLQDIEVKQLKTSGETREKVEYVDADQATIYLLKRVKESKSVNEVLELIGDALIASLLADEAELPQSKRVHHQPRPASELLKVLATDIKSVRPRRQRVKAAA